MIYHINRNGISHRIPSNRLKTIQIKYKIGSCHVCAKIPSYRVIYKLDGINIVEHCTRHISELSSANLINPEPSDRNTLSEQKDGFDELEQLRLDSAKLADSYRRIFYKVDPALVFDLVTRMQQDPKNPKPMYTVEVFTKDGTDPQKSRDHILQTTGSVPAIFDKGTHYVSHHRLNLEILKKLNDIDYVLEVMGDYTGSGASIGPQHDLGDWKKIKDKVTHK